MVNSTSTLPHRSFTITATQNSSATATQKKSRTFRLPRFASDFLQWRKRPLSPLAQLNNLRDVLKVDFTANSDLQLGDRELRALCRLANNIPGASLEVDLRGVNIFHNTEIVTDLRNCPWLNVNASITLLYGTSGHCDSEIESITLTHNDQKNLLQEEDQTIQSLVKALSRLQRRGVIDTNFCNRICLSIVDLKPGDQPEKLLCHIEALEGLLTKQRHVVPHLERLSMSTLARIGLEIEVEPIILVEGSSADALKKHSRIDLSKDGLCELQVELAGIAHALEYVTKPLRNRDELIDAVKYSVESLSKIIRCLNHKRRHSIGHYDLVPRLGNKIDITLSCRPQLTTSVSLDQIETLMATVSRYTNGLKGCVHSGEQKILTAVPLKESMDDKAAGLARLVVYFIASFSESDRFAFSPKEILPLMPRTDFKSMYQSLTTTQKKEVKAYFTLLKRNYTVTNPFLYKENECQRVFLYLGGMRCQELSAKSLFNSEAPSFPNIRIADWLDSITDDEQSKDLMSPPSYFRDPRVIERYGQYGMGSQGLDLQTLNPIIEIRCFHAMQGDEPLVVDAHLQHRLDAGIEQLSTLSGLARFVKK